MSELDQAPMLEDESTLDPDDRLSGDELEAALESLLLVVDSPASHQVGGGGGGDAPQGGGGTA
ncbi:hypothetical protein ACFWPB_07185, partial [Rhodococcus sp. NPDC058514]